MGDFIIKSNLYSYRNHINIIKDIKLFITRGTMKVEYQYKGVPIIKQFMIPFNEVYHLINGEFSSDIMKSDKNWYEDNIYIFGNVGEDIFSADLLSNLQNKKQY